MLFRKGGRQRGRRKRRRGRVASGRGKDYIHHVPCGLADNPLLLLFCAPKALQKPCEKERHRRHGGIPQGQLVVGISLLLSTHDLHVVPGTYQLNAFSDGVLVTGMCRAIDTVLCTSHNLGDGTMETGITVRRCLLALEDTEEIVARA